MDIRLCCSENIRLKLEKRLKTHNITSSEDASISLVERGHVIPSGTIGIVFDSIDYMEAIDMLGAMSSNQDNKADDNLILGYYKDRYTIIKPESIQFIEVKGTEVTCVTENNKFYMKKPLYHYEMMLESFSFIRINKSQLVNLMKVKEIVPWFNSRLVLSLESDIQLEVSKKYAKVLRKKLKI